MLHPKTAFFSLPLPGFYQIRLLNSVGDSLSVDGNFWSKTYAAVMDFQKSKGLKVDGVAGKYTVTALGGKWAK